MGANAQTAVPVFTAGQVLTAAQQTQINTGVPVFATTVTRDAAFGGTGEKTLAEGQFAYLEDSNTTQYYDGAAWQSVGFAPTVAIFNEQQSSGTQGGTFTSGSYVKRTLNSTVTNGITSCTLTSSVISLPAGTYNVFAFAPALNVQAHKLRLQNTTASSTIAIGMNAFSNAATVATHSFINTQFTLSTTSNIELQHRAEGTSATVGLGAACGFADVEVYAQIQITKIA